MSINDLKISRKSSHLRTAMCEGVNHVFRKNCFLSSNGASSASSFSSVCRPIQRQFQDQGVLLPRSISMHGFCPTDLSREPTRHRIMSVGAEEQALSHGDPLFDFSQQFGQRQQGQRLAYLRRSCLLSYTYCAKTLCEREFWPGTGKHRLRSGRNHHRSVPVHVPVGQVPQEQGSNQASHIAGSTRQHSVLHPHIRRQDTRSEYSRHRATGSRFFLRHGSWLSGLRTAICNHSGISFLRDKSQIQSQVPAGLFPFSGQGNRHSLRSVSAAHRVLSSERLSGQTASSAVSRQRNRQIFGFSDQQFQSTGNDNWRIIPMSLAGRVVLSMDQAEPEDQNFLRNIRERCQSPNLDCRVSLRACCHHEKAAQNQGKPLHNSTGLERYHL